MKSINQIPANKLYNGMKLADTAGKKYEIVLFDKHHHYPDYTSVVVRSNDTNRIFSKFHHEMRDFYFAE